MQEKLTSRQTVRNNPELTNLPSEKPPHQTDGVLGLVVAWDSDIDETQRRIGIAKRNDWDIHISRFTNWLMIGTWVGDNQKTRLSESRLNIQH